MFQILNPYHKSTWLVGCLRAYPTPFFLFMLHNRCATLLFFSLCICHPTTILSSPGDFAERRLFRPGCGVFLYYNYQVGISSINLFVPIPFLVLELPVPLPLMCQTAHMCGTALHFILLARNSFMNSPRHKSSFFRPACFFLPCQPQGLPVTYLCPLATFPLTSVPSVPFFPLHS